MANCRKRKAPALWDMNVGHSECYMLGDGDTGAWYLEMLPFPERPCPPPFTLMWADGSCGHAEGIYFGGQLWNVTCKCYRCATEDF